MPSSRSPTPEFSMPSDSRIGGTRDAQVEMLSPLARKMAQIAMCQRTSWDRVSVECMSTLYRIDSTHIESIR
jgi:hypothetical protein